MKMKERGYKKAIPDKGEIVLSEANLRVKRILDEAIERRAFPGAQVVYGKSLEAKQEVDAGAINYSGDSVVVSKETIYDVASLTKMFTLTGVLILATEGRVRLDDEVDDILDSNFPGVTIRHLLSHTSGLRLSLSGLKDLSPDQINSRIMASGPLVEPGKQFYYSNQGYYVLGKVIEEISEMSLDNFLKKGIFDRLGLRNTFFTPAHGLRGRIAPTEIDPWRGGLVWGEVHDEIAYKMGGVAGHAGLFSTGDDLFKLGIMWLNKGQNVGIRIISQELIREATVCNFPLAKNAIGDGSFVFALGWRLGDRRFTGNAASEQTYSFSGFTGPSLVVDPEKNLVIAVMNNRIYPSRESGIERVKYTAKIADLIYQGLEL